MKTSVLVAEAGRAADQAWLRLGPLARVLLASDGTLTELLEALAGEPVTLRKLREETLPVAPTGGTLSLAQGDWVVERLVLLHGLRTGRPLVHARVLIVANRLGVAFREDLLGTDAPIGKLWRRHRIELFREPLTRQLAPAGELADLLGCDDRSPVWSRTSRIQEHGRPVMLITETFAPALVARAG